MCLQVHPGIAAGVSAGIALVVALISLPLVAKAKQQAIQRHLALKAGPSTTTSTGGVEIEVVATKAGKAADSVDQPAAAPATGAKRVWNNVSAVLMTSLNADPHASVDDNETVAAIHANAEAFDGQTELMFRNIQIFTAICASFAHGANDVANAIGAPTHSQSPAPNRPLLIAHS